MKTQSIKEEKEVTNEPLYFEMQDNFSSFYISDFDVLKCVLIADSNKKIPTLTDDWIKQAQNYIQKMIIKLSLLIKILLNFKILLKIFIALIVEIAISAFFLRIQNTNLFFH